MIWNISTIASFHFTDVLDIILKDVEDFDPQTWVYAVTLSVTVLAVLGLSVCIMLLRDHYLDMEEKRLKGDNFEF